MKRSPMLEVTLAGVALLSVVYGCGSSSQVAQVKTVVVTKAVDALPAGSVNVPELVANGEATEWARLAASDKTAVADRFLAVAPTSGVTSADLVAAADIAAEAGAASGSMRDFLGTLAPAATGLGSTAAVAPLPPDASVDPNPDGTYTSRCAYVLGDFSSNTSSGFRLIASAKLKNTGNIGTVSKVTGIWDRLGSDPLKKTKTVKVAAGKSRTVNFTVPIDQDTLDLIQAANGDCRVRSSIAGTFGVAR